MARTPDDREKSLSEREKREARLAEALRANLRRRKLGGQGRPKPQRPEPQEE